MSARVKLFLLVLCCLGIADRHAAANDRPNIVFILADDLGWRDVGYAGSTYHRTPNIDALSKQGMIFTQAYAANPLCSPTRASILTGQYPARIGITAPAGHRPEVLLQPTIAARARPDWKCLSVESATRLDTKYVTLAETLKEAGYVTGHFGKWHLGAEPYSPLQQGFDIDLPHWSGPGPAGSYVAPWRFPKKLFEPKKPQEHIEDRMAEEASAFIRSNKDKPFFLNYWSFSVHAPYDAKRALIDHYRMSMDAANPQHNPIYAAMVHSLDDAVGTLVKTLRENDLLDKTLIVFFSDNGGINFKALQKRGRGNALSDLATPYADIPPTSNAPLRAGKASIYEGGLREPCFVVWPGVVQAGSTSDAMIQSIDFYPTLAEITGAKLPSGQVMDGRSFLPVLAGKTAAHREIILTHFPHNMPANDQVPAAAVRKGAWKLIRFFHDGPDGADRFELYNLQEDLGETTNRVSEQPARLAELNAILDTFLVETGALVPGPNPRFRPQ